MMILSMSPCMAYGQRIGAQVAYGSLDGRRSSAHGIDWGKRLARTWRFCATLLVRGAWASSRMLKSSLSLSKMSQPSRFPSRS
jgi:hypothetical protein